uniref:Uncharacterized protein n=1 Tax=Romanomermis culicivorax TaxID=13658 RepID=A0A915KFA1_ROMCU
MSSVRNNLRQRKKQISGAENQTPAMSEVCTATIRFYHEAEFIQTASTVGMNAKGDRSFSKNYEYELIMLDRNYSPYFGKLMIRFKC